MIVIRLTFELGISYLQVDPSGLGIYLRRWFFDLLYFSWRFYAELLSIKS